MPARALLAGLAAAQLQSGIDLIARLEDDAWTATVPPIAASTVGAHFRHVFDHVNALLAGLHGGIVDYDQRARDPRIEQDRAHALAHARRLGALLRGLGDGKGPLRVLQDSGERGARAVADSTWARELQFVIAHTVHHHALIGLLLRIQGVAVDASFGVAPSTLRHLAAQSPCAR